MKNSIRILSLLMALFMVVAVLSGCAKESKKEKKDTSALSGRETEIVTDENGETTVVYIDDTEKTTDKKSGDDTPGSIGGDEDTAEGASSEKGNTAGEKSGGKNTAETTGAGKEKDPGKSSGGEKSKETTGGYTEIVIPAETREKRDPADAKLPNGVSFKDVSISRLDDTVSIEFSVVNSTGEEQVVDFSYIVMKVNNKTEIVNTFDVMSIAPGKMVLCSMPIEDESVDLSIGTSVTVYFGYDLIGTATVGLF